MRIGFVNYTPMVYDVETPLNEPLGGSESAMCYLAVELAKLGHEVTLFGRKNKSFELGGVKHVPDRLIVNGGARDLDFLIIQNTPEYVSHLARYLDQKTKIIFWTQHAPDQPAVGCLHNKRLVNLYSAIVFISEWQESVYNNFFDLAGIQQKVLRNAISPVFENLPAVKKKNLTLAYTSTPFRGLEVLVKLFPRILSNFPEVSLKVYSGMKTYQEIFSRDLFRDLYKKCEQMEGVEYVGPIAQRDLAVALKDVSILAYPNTFRETSCISVMEAMASGAWVVTSNLAALPETMAGFGTLVEVGKTEEEFEANFFKSLSETILRYYEQDEAWKKRLQEQVRFVNENYIWSRRAREWEGFLGEMKREA